ncbi:MAG: alcohol dehydrogenase catalytic domain-containing protein [Candidatus Omnitrophica bacterium]|nr:alcohol dehydrogenase catalytic domain-containing protein [Candidatus Omnitrophota bacterium]
MRVATYYNNRDIRIEEVPRPEIGPGELLIRVRASGICGTDVLEWYRRDKTPLILGHEIAGEIEEVGAGLSQFKKGTRVSASHHVPCGKCSWCLRGHATVCQTLRKTHFDPGGFVEYLRLPAINIELGGVYPLQDNVSYAEATFTEPLACVLRAQTLAQGVKEKIVLVMGCGISGLLHVQLAKAHGATLVVATDIVDYRLECARKQGADAIINVQKEALSERLRQLSQGRGADLVIVATGAKSANAQALEVVERGGTVLFFAATEEGVSIPLSINNVFWRNEVTLTSSYAATPQEHLAALELISSAKIQVLDLITHRLGLDKIQEGFRLVAEAENSLKVVIFPFPEE